jgi:uncharacterized protein (TIGR02594 family)
MATYMVRSGGRLPRIVKRFEISLDELLRMNPQIRNPNLARRGSILHVPASLQSTPLPPSMPDRIGDTPWYEVAKHEMAMGVDDISGLEDNPRIVAYHQTTTLGADYDEMPWCSSFVNWCVEQACLRGTGSALARSWLDWGKPLTTPRRGCIVVLSRGSKAHQGHVGFYHEDDRNRILVLGGNQGNRVTISSYPIQKPRS